MDILILMQFSELTKDAERQLSLSWDFIMVWPLCVHGEFRDVKAILIYEIMYFFFICKHNDVGRNRDWTIVVQVFVSVSLNSTQLNSTQIDLFKVGFDKNI